MDLPALPEGARDRPRRDRGVEVDFQPNLGKDKDKLAEIIGNYDGLAIRSATKATAKIIDKATRLKVIGRAGIGVDNVEIPAATAKNMDISLTVPTATSVRTLPVKLLWDNRTVINNHLARARGGKVSFTHIIGFALVKALKQMPEMNNGFDVIDGPRSAWSVSLPGAIPWRRQVCSISRFANAALSWCATIQPTT